MYQLFTGKSNLENNLEAVRVIRDPHLNIGKGIAYVLFKTKVRLVKKNFLILLRFGNDKSPFIRFRKLQIL